MQERKIRPVIGTGPNGCERWAARGGMFGKVKDSVAVAGGEVWEIHWQDGTMDLWWTGQYVFP
jgi:hypothetical protein